MDRLLEHLLADASLTDFQKAQMAEALAECDKCVTDGADEELQLFSIVSSFQVGAAALAAVLVVDYCCSRCCSALQMPHPQRNAEAK
jgi:hypothetical protein